MLYRDKETSKQITRMSDFLDMLRDFTNFTGKIERDIHNAAFRIKLPDEIDLYNFFETWGGRAICTYTIEHEDLPCRDEEITVVAKSISRLEDVKGICSTVEYDIHHSRYYAIKFKNRGVFLVSEKRYNELKAKKGK